MTARHIHAATELLHMPGGLVAALDALATAQQMQTAQHITDGWTEADDIITRGRHAAYALESARDAAHRILTPFKPAPGAQS